MTEFTLEFKDIKVIDNSTFSSVFDKSLITKIEIYYNEIIHTINNDVFLEFINLKILLVYRFCIYITYLMVMRNLKNIYIDLVNLTHLN